MRDWGYYPKTHHGAYQSYITGSDTKQLDNRPVERLSKLNLFPLRSFTWVTPCVFLWIKEINSKSRALNKEYIMKEETMKLLKERHKVAYEIEALKTTSKRLTNDMCELEGSCPHCNNWHYPHCGM